MAPLWSWRWTSLRILSQHTKKTYGLSSFLGRLYIWKEGTGAGLKCLKSDATPHRRDDYRVERSCSSNLSIVSQSVSQRWCRCDFSVDAFHTRYTQSRTKHTKREITITTSVNIRESRPAPMTFFFFFLSIRHHAVRTIFQPLLIVVFLWRCQHSKVIRSFS
jgi:hypothetical protein